MLFRMTGWNKPLGLFLCWSSMKASLLREKRCAVAERGDRKGVRQAEREKSPSLASLEITTKGREGWG